MKLQASTCGTPQGGVISPLLANIFLNELGLSVNREKTKVVKLKAGETLAERHHCNSESQKPWLEKLLQRRILKEKFQGDELVCSTKVQVIH